MWGGTGFRDLYTFNLAMLAKQGWRISQNLDSLIARVLKAKYYPFGYFLEAHQGANPSYTWQSLVARRDILKDGLAWRIGDGVKVDIRD